MADVTLTSGTTWVATDTGKITIEGWGGGGAGGAGTSSSGGGGGGGAGAYAKTTNVSVTKDVTYNYVIGAAGVGNKTGQGGSGTDTTFNAGAGNVMVADGGIGGQDYAGGQGGGAGGAVANCTYSGAGSAAYKGGDGGAGSSTTGGGGGESASASGAGNNGTAGASGGAGGTGTNGYDGAAGGAAHTNGGTAAAGNYGAAGGGAGDQTGGAETGGSGMTGKIDITFTSRSINVYDTVTVDDGVIYKQYGHFDISVSGPTDADAVWTNDGFAFDTDYTNSATGPGAGTSSNTEPTNFKLTGTGSDITSITGNTITAVNVITQNATGDISDSSHDASFDLYPLTAPTGGWDLTKIQNLQTRFWRYYDAIFTNCNFNVYSGAEQLITYASGYSQSGNVTALCAGAGIRVKSFTSAVTVSISSPAANPQPNVYDSSAVTDAVVQVKINPLKAETFDTSTVTDEIIQVKVNPLQINVFDESAVTDVVIDVVIKPLKINVYDESAITDEVTVVTPKLKINVYEDSVVTDEIIQVKVNPLQISVFDESAVTDVFLDSRINPLLIDIFDSPTVTESIVMSGKLFIYIQPGWKYEVRIT